MRITQKVNDVYKAKPWAYYFDVKLRIYVDFQICISVPLIKISITLPMDRYSAKALKQQCFILMYSC